MLGGFEQGTPQRSVPHFNHSWDSKYVIVKPLEMSWLCPLLSFHMIMLSLLGVAASVAVWTHKPALDIDRIPYIEMGSVHCQSQDSSIVSCIIDSGRESS